MIGGEKPSDSPSQMAKHLCRLKLLRQFLLNARYVDNGSLNISFALKLIQVIAQTQMWQCQTMPQGSIPWFIWDASLL